MAKRGRRLIRSAKEALAFSRGEADLSAYRIHVPADIDVKAIRRKLDMTQVQFAARFGFTINQIRDLFMGGAALDGRKCIHDVAVVDHRQEPHAPAILDRPQIP